MSAEEIVREIIDELIEGRGWPSIADSYGLCHTCGGVPMGQGSSGYFKECDSNDCDEAFEKMCDDFISEVGNGNSTRCLMRMLYDSMEKHGDLERFANEGRDFIEANGFDTKDMTQEDIIWERLDSYWDNRRILNERIVEYWKQDWRQERYE